MKIKSLELKNYKRIPLGKVSYFKLDLVTPVQLILGTNGSGKSSILSELSPLPADKESFRKGKEGLKRVTLEHNGKNYVVTSNYGQGRSHSFLMDGLELNDGGTITVQRELVKEHFGLTQEIHELITGIESFVKMSAPRRREWFTRLCTADYMYAIKLYKKIQERLNMISGALKHAKKRLASESVKAIDESEALELRQRVSELTAESQRMYMLREVSTTPLSDIRQSVGSLVNDLERLCSEYRSIRRVLKDRSYFTVEELQEDVSHAQIELATVQSRYETFSSEFLKLSDETISGEELDTVELMALRQKVADTKARIDQLKSSCSMGLHFDRPKVALDVFDSLYYEFTTAVSDLPLNENGRYSPENLTEAGDKLRRLEISLDQINKDYIRFEHERARLESLSKGEKHECPKCEHRFVSGFNEATFQRVSEQTLQVHKRLEECKRLVTEAVQECTHQKDYYDRRTYVHSLIRSSPELTPIWDEVISQGLLNSAPQSVISFMDRVRNDLQKLCLAQELLEACKSDVLRLEHAELAQGEVFKKKKQRLKELEVILGQLSAQQAAAVKRLDDANTTVRRLRTLNSIVDRIQAAKEQLHGVQHQAVLSIKNDLIDEALEQTHIELAGLSTRLNGHLAHESLINDIKSQIEDLTQQESAAKLLAKTMSPVDGLIAEGMLGFIRVFVARMNLFISQVWTYGMEVKDCSLEENSAELNYKFPVYLPELDDTVPDVSKCSSGMSEICDLAFRMVATQCLGLENGPLTLDEFGKTFDEAHRAAATRVISQLMDSTSFSQLFMVSHYETSWGAFYKAQITVMDKRNITLPAGVKYNENVLIEA